MFLIFSFSHLGSIFETVLSAVDLQGFNGDFFKNLSNFIIVDRKYQFLRIESGFTYHGRSGLHLPVGNSSLQGDGLNVIGVFF